MGDIRYNPAFAADDLVDEVDPIRAAGPRGFNARFHTIEDDLVGFSGVVARIDAALTAVATGPTEHTFWLPPQLLPTTGGAPWQLTATGAAQDTPGTSPNGLVNLTLPDGIRLKSIRAIGQCTSGIIVTIRLFRCPFGSATTQVMSTIAANGNPYDTTMPVDESLARVATGTFRYFLTASAPITPIAGPTSVVFAGLQVAYSTV
jgi:hypothetical protein